MKLQRRFSLAFFCAVALFARFTLADDYDPPPTYYNTATGTGATLKQQLNDIIDNHTVLSYDAARANLQISDADTAHPGHIITVYDRTSLDVSSLSASGIPGWNGTVWNREHTWPRSRGVGDTGPDDSDMFELRPALVANNGDRGELNFGGAFGAQSWGSVSDGGQTYWYPGDADAGMIARQEFYMAVRYDGVVANTHDLEIAAGNVGNPTGPDDPPPQLGNLNRLIEWNYAAPPDTFERRRNQVIYDQFQRNRDPFVDHPEWAWSIFVNQANDSQVSIAGATVNANGGSTRNVDLGRVFVNAAVPAAQSFTLNKAGNNGTYFEVTTSGAVTSSISGRLNAFRTNQTDSKSISVGISTTTSTAGLKSGTVTVDNLDITTGGGTGHGANDANDTFNVSLAVLDHPVASFSANLVRQVETIDFAIVPIGSSPVGIVTSFTNLSANGAPLFAANLDLDGITGTGDTSDFQVDLAPFTGLQQGGFVAFNSFFAPQTVGQFAATYTLNLSDENLPGEQMQSLTLSLIGKAILAGDYNGDLIVDAGDYTIWRDTMGQSVAAYSSADGDGNGVINGLDYDVWRNHFGQTASGSGAAIGSASVPEPASILLALMSVSPTFCSRTRRV